MPRQESKTNQTAKTREAPKTREEPKTNETGKTNQAGKNGDDAPDVVPQAEPDPNLSPIDYLTSIYRDESVPREKRMDAAKAVVAYMHPRMTPAKPKSDKKPPRRIEIVWGPPD